MRIKGLSKEQRKLAKQVFDSADKHEAASGVGRRIGDLEEAFEVLLVKMSEKEMDEVRPVLAAIFDRVGISMGKAHEKRLGKGN